jgi:hypothetical protein
MEDELVKLIRGAVFATLADRIQFEVKAKGAGTGAGAAAGVEVFNEAGDGESGHFWYSRFTAVEVFVGEGAGFRGHIIDRSTGRDGGERLGISPCGTMLVYSPATAALVRFRHQTLSVVVSLSICLVQFPSGFG